MLATLVRDIRVHRTGKRTPPQIVITPVWEPAAA
jgi:hypothetical protein